MRTVELAGGRSLHAVTRGKGPDLVLLHGALATSHDWIAGPYDALAAAGWRVTAVDRPGHGLSPRPRFEGTPRDQAKQIRAGLEALGIGTAMLVGHSIGGIVALAYAELFPELVSGLVLVAPIAFPEWRLIEHSMFAPRALPVTGPLFSSFAGQSFDPPALEMVQKLMFSPQPVDPGWKASYPYGQVLSRDSMVAEAEELTWLLPFAPTGLMNVAAIRTPAHILTGSADRVLQDEWQAKQLARLMPNARLTEVDGVGHMLHHARPDLVVDAVREMAPAPA